MKTSFSKILLPLLLIAVCWGGTSCNNNEPEVAQFSQLEGLWRIHREINGQKQSLDIWFRFHEDMTAETYFYNTQNNSYQYSQGTCKLLGNTLTVKDQSERFWAISNNLLRCAAEFKEPQPEWTDWKIQITSITDNEIKASINGSTAWLMRENNLPSFWPEGCDEPDKQATLEDLCCRWDLRSYYRLTGNDFHVWYLTWPETEGMSMVENGGFANIQFFVNDLITKERNAGHLNAKDSINVSFSDCAWSANTKQFVFACTGYKRIIADDYGTAIGNEYVQPENPFVLTYTIYTFTENWLTLYSSEDDYYFSFRKSLK